MRSPDSPDLPTVPAPLEVSAKAWGAIAQVAFVGRLVLVAAGLLSLLSVFVETDGVGALTKTIVALASLGLIAVAALGTTRPRRAFDLAAVLVALTLAGTWGFYAFASLGNDTADELYVLPFFAWLGTLGGGLAVGAVLVPGPSVAVPVDVEAAIRRRRGRSTPSTATTGPAAEVEPPETATGPREPPAGSPTPPVSSRDETAATPREPFARPTTPDAGPPPARTSDAEETVVAPRPDGPATPPAETAPTIPLPASSSADTDPAGRDAPSSRHDDAPSRHDDAPSAPARPTPPARRSAPAADLPDAGWYPASDGVNARWWDGRAWTDERRPLADFDDGRA